ncbi:MAG: BatD family protein, partial [Steroidobacteraceae bacterium]
MSGLVWRALAIAPVSRLAKAGPLVLGLMLALSSLPAHAAVQASLDTNQVAPGDSVQLTLEYEGQTSTEPDLSPLERDFDVLGSNRVTTFEIVNGNTSAKTQLAVTLSPKHAGRLTVPSLVWGGQRSPALALDVSASAGGGGGGASSSGQRNGAATQAREVFLQTEFGPAQPYVQAAVTVTLRLYTREALYNPRITFSGTHDVLIRQVGSDETGSARRGGESYEVVTRHYVVFPEQSGRLSLPGPVLDAQVPVGNPAATPLNDPFAGLLGPTPFAGSMLSGVKPIRLHGDPIALDVRPRPAGAVGSYWIPASEVTLQSSWDPAALQTHAGDPVTADLSLQAVGLTAAQLPDLSQLIPLPAGLKAYPDQAKLSDTARGNAVVGTRTQSIALIADQPGHFTIPAFRLQWWDTGSHQPREITLPARTLIVTPAGGSAVSAQPAPARASTADSEPAAASAPRLASASPSAATRALGASGAPQGGHLLAGRAPVWLVVSAVLALAWLVTLGAWLRLRRRAGAAL